MILKTVIIFTILSIIGEYKGTTCTNDISVYMENFKINSFDEFNLVCYLSMYGSIDLVLKDLNDNQGKETTYVKNLSDDIGHVHMLLFQINGWFTYLLVQSTIDMWDNYNNIIKWTKDYIVTEPLQKDVKFTIDGNKFKSELINGLKTPKGKKFIEIFCSNSKKQISILLSTTLKFCQSTLKSLTKTTMPYNVLNITRYLRKAAHLNYPFDATYGYLILLMLEEEFKSFNNCLDDEELSILYLLRVTDEVVKDIHNGIFYILNEIFRSNISPADLKTTGNGCIDIELLKMIIPVLETVLNASYKLHSILNSKYVVDIIPSTKYSNGTPFIMSDTYIKFMNDVQNIWITITTNLNAKENSSIGEKEETSGSETFLLPDGRLFKDKKVYSSLIGYYAVFIESWEFETELDYLDNTDSRKVFLMDLYAWSKMSDIIVQDFMKSELISNIIAKPTYLLTPNFTEYINFFSTYRYFFQISNMRKHFNCNK